MILLALLVLCLSNLSLIQAIDNTIMLDKLDDFNIDTIKSHNKYRWDHGVDPLILDNKLIKLAQEMAKKSADHGKYVFEKPTFKDGTPGAIYATITGYDDFNGYNLSQLWYTSYDRYGKKTNGQMIWKSTKLAGFGKAKCPISGKIFMVGFYYPPGMIPGEEKDNILPLTTPVPLTTTPKPVKTNNRPYGQGPIIANTGGVTDTTTVTETTTAEPQFGLDYHDYDEYLTEDERYEIRRLTNRLRKMTTRTQLLDQVEKIYQRFSGRKMQNKSQARVEIDRVINKLRRIKSYY